MVTVGTLIQKKTKGAEIPNVLKTRYVNYENKVDLCRRIVDVTMRKKVGDVEMFCADTPTQYFQFEVVLIQEYTDIYLGADKELIKNMNLLRKHGLLADILKQIPDFERGEFKMILDMCVNDYMENNRSITSFLETKFQANQIVLEKMMGEILDRIKEVKSE